MVDVRCPNCNTSFVVGDDCNAVKHIKDGISYLVPSVVRNDNLGETTMNEKAKARMAALKEAGIDVSKLQTLMSKDESLRNIFTDDNDPILEEIGKGGFIHNAELFRRWITAQTFKLLNDRYGWTHAVRNHYDANYVLKQCKKELGLLVKLEQKGLKGRDKRFEFFTLQDLKRIYISLLQNGCAYVCYSGDLTEYVARIDYSASYSELYSTILAGRWHIYRRSNHFLPKDWLNCFKGAGAYYTLQNIIRTHGLIIPNCKDMNESLEKVDELLKNITSYEPKFRRWDLMMTLLVYSVKTTHFELKY